MKTFIKITILLFTLIFAGCWDVYNTILNDMDDDYNFYLVVTNNWDTTNSDIYIYSSNDNTGILTQSFDQLNDSYPFYAAIHPTGNYLYVTKNYNAQQDNSQSGILMYQVFDNGNLSLLGTATTGINPHGIKVHPSGNYVYAAIHNDNAIAMFHVNNLGTLDSLSPSTISSNGTGPTRLAIDPTGNYLYVANTDSSNIGSFQINNDGTLASLGFFAGAPTSNIKDIIVDSSGHVYITSTGGSGIYLYDRLANTATGQGAFSTNNGYLAINPSGMYLYVSDTAIEGFCSYRINGNGSLTFLNNAGMVSDTRDILVHPSGNYLYTAHRGGGRLDTYILNNDGTIQNSYYQRILIGEACGLAIFRKKVK